MKDIEDNLDYCILGLEPGAIIDNYGDEEVGVPYIGSIDDILFNELYNRELITEIFIENRYKLRPIWDCFELLVRCIKDLEDKPEPIHIIKCPDSIFNTISDG